MDDFTNSNRCVGMFGAFFGHRFEPRYNIDEGQPTLKNARGANTTASEIKSIVEASKPCKKKYVADVCVRCGKRKLI